MIYPTPEQLSKKGKYNRYTLVIAASKCAREITDDYAQKRSQIQKMAENKETDKSILAMIRKEISDEKSVTLAVRAFNDGDYYIHDETVPENTTTC